MIPPNYHMYKYYINVRKNHLWLIDMRNQLQAQDPQNRKKTATVQEKRPNEETSHVASFLF